MVGLVIADTLVLAPNLPETHYSRWGRLFQEGKEPFKQSFMDVESRKRAGHVFFVSMPLYQYLFVFAEGGTE